MVKNLPAVQQTRVQFLGREDSLEEEMTTHSSILAWEITWTGEPGGLQSTGSEGVRQDRVTKQQHLGVLLSGVSLAAGIFEPGPGRVSVRPPARRELPLQGMWLQAADFH